LGAFCKILANLNLLLHLSSVGGVLELIFWELQGTIDSYFILHSNENTNSLFDEGIYQPHKDTRTNLFE
jgi:hypothetical protein